MLAFRSSCVSSGQSKKDAGQLLRAALFRAEAKPCQVGYSGQVGPWADVGKAQDSRPHDPSLQSRFQTQVNFPSHGLDPPPV